MFSFVFDHVSVEFTMIGSPYILHCLILVVFHLGFVSSATRYYGAGNDLSIIDFNRSTNRIEFFLYFVFYSYSISFYKSLSNNGSFVYSFSTTQ